MESVSRAPAGRMAAAVAQVLGVLEAHGAGSDYVNVSWGSRTERTSVHVVYDTEAEARAAAAAFPPGSGDESASAPEYWCWQGRLGDVEVRLQGAREAEAAEAAS